MWARTVSYLFHPLFLPAYFFVFLAWALPNMLEPIALALQPRFLLAFAAVTWGLPLLNVAIFRAFGTIRSFAMRDRRDRVLPFFFVAVVYVALTYMFVSQQMMNLNDNFLRLLIIIDVLVIAAALITMFYKVSVHALAVWGLAGIMLALSKLTGASTIFYATPVVIVIAGVVMSARLQTGGHTPREVAWGAATGLLTGVAGTLILF